MNHETLIDTIVTEVYNQPVVSIHTPINYVRTPNGITLTNKVIADDSELRIIVFVRGNTDVGAGLGGFVLLELDLEGCCYGFAVKLWRFVVDVLDPYQQGQGLGEVRRDAVVCGFYYHL